MIISSGMLDGITNSSPAESWTISRTVIISSLCRMLLFSRLLEKVVLDAEVKRMKQIEVVEETAVPKKSPFGSLLK